MRRRGRVVVPSLLLVAAVACVQERVRPQPRNFRFTNAEPVSTQPSATRGAEAAAGPRKLDAKEAAAAPGPQDDAIRADVQVEPGATERSPFHRFEWNVIRN